MPASPELVTVVIPVFNGARFLAEAIDSALAQTWPHKEVLVVDDGSSDGGATAGVAARYGDRIRYFFKNNGGVGSALNRGILEMRGDWFTWLSHDDLYHPRKLEAQLRRTEIFGSRAPVFSDFDVFETPGKTVYTAVFDGSALLQRPLFAVFEGMIHGCTMLLPREAFARCGLFDERRPTTQDVEFWYRLLQVYPLLHVPEVLVHSRTHVGQGSRIARHLDEAGLLWLEMLERTPASTMIAHAGSVEGFLGRVSSYLAKTPYLAARAGLAAKYPNIGDRLDPLASLTGLRRFVRRLVLSPAGAPVLAAAEALSRIPTLSSRLTRMVERLYGVREHIASAWYAEQYPPTAGSAAVLDYLRRGWQAGRDPSPDFSTSRYLALAPESGRNGMNPLSHAALSGYLASVPAATRAPEPGLPRIFVVHDGSPAARRLTGGFASAVQGVVDRAPTMSDRPERVLLIAGGPEVAARALAIAAKHHLPLDVYALRPLPPSAEGKRFFAPNGFAALSIPGATMAEPPDVAPVDTLTAWQRQLGPREALRVVVFRGFDSRPLPPIVAQVAELARSGSPSLLEIHVVGGPPPLPSQPALQHHPHPGDSLIVTAVCRIAAHIAWLPDHPVEFHSYDLSDAMLCGLPVVAPLCGSYVERLQRRGYGILYSEDANSEELAAVLMGARALGTFGPPAGSVAAKRTNWPDILGSTPPHHCGSCDDLRGGSL